MRKSGPEKLVELEVISWGNRNGFDLTVVDTSAVWNPIANRYLSKQASESLPDLIGNYGWLSVWIELKAPGRRCVINSKSSQHQRAFIMRKIKQGCFAVVSDGEKHMRLIWEKYKKASQFERPAILIADLPVERVTKLSSHPGIASKKLPPGLE
jgi:hypothetical protein